jgi:PIN domain nuclease of toxin-antitoxin system
MRLLLDTHILVWLATDRAQINRGERLLLEREDTTLLFSVISIWELRVKWRALDRHGNRKGPLPPERALEFLQRSGLELVPLTGSDCAIQLSPPSTHPDPFDEMLLVHAQRLDAQLLTRDGHLRDHPRALIAQP